MFLHSTVVILLVISLSAQLRKTIAQHEDCLTTGVDSFVRSFPGGDSCLENLSSLADYRSLQATSSPNVICTEKCEPELNQTTQINVSLTLDAICTAECGGIYSTYVDLVCGIDSVQTPLICLPSSGSLGDRCFYSYPDRIDISLLTNLSVCESVITSSSCPSECVQALNELVNQLGCCFEDLYTDYNIELLEVLFRLTTSQTTFIRNLIDNFYLITTRCSVEPLQACSLDNQPFSGEPVLAYGICKESEVNGFLSNTSSNCIANYNSLTFDDFSPSQQALDVVCTDVCGGQIANYLKRTCYDHISSSLIEVSCLQTQGTLGDRCYYSFADPFIQRVSETIVNCSSFLSDDSICPVGCREHLMGLKEQAGCCFSSILNSSSIVSILHGGERRSMSTINIITNSSLWNICRISLVNPCSGEPFRVTLLPTTTSESSTYESSQPVSEIIVASVIAGTIEFVASTLVILTLNVVVAIIFLL